MISFIIIGKNIENTINRCIDSVLQFIESNQIANSEIIYVDSNSTDNTIGLAKTYSVKIIKLSGSINAAVGRNEGANHSSGNILFFIDGDMEIHSSFYHVAFIDQTRLYYPFCSGIFINHYYDIDFNFIKSEKSPVISLEQKKRKYSVITGGLFIIERKKWIEQSGMDDRFNRNQDIDFGIRMARKKQPLMIYQNLLATHHTIDYFNKGRIISFLKSNYLMFYGVLIRKHFFSLTFIKLLFRGRYTMFILIASLFNYYILLLYFFLQILRTIKRNNNFFNSLLYKLFTDIYCLIGVLFFYPNHKKYKTEIIKPNHKYSFRD